LVDYFCNLVMGLGQIFLTRVGLGQFLVALIGLGQFLVARIGSGQFLVTWIGLGKFLVARIELGQFLVARVESAIYGLGWIWKISPKNAKLFNFFPLYKKNLFGLGQKVPGLKAGWPLIYCRSKVCSGRVRAHL